MILQEPSHLQVLSSVVLVMQRSYATYEHASILRSSREPSWDLRLVINFYHLVERSHLPHLDLFLSRSAVTRNCYDLAVAVLPAYHFHVRYTGASIPTPLKLYIVTDERRSRCRRDEWIQYMAASARSLSGHAMWVAEDFRASCLYQSKISLCSKVKQAFEARFRLLGPAPER